MSNFILLLIILLASCVPEISLNKKLPELIITEQKFIKLWDEQISFSIKKIPVNFTKILGKKIQIIKLDKHENIHLVKNLNIKLETENININNTRMLKPGQIYFLSLDNLEKNKLKPIYAFKLKAGVKYYKLKLLGAEKNIISVQHKNFIWHTNIRLPRIKKINLEVINKNNYEKLLLTNISYDFNSKIIQASLAQHKNLTEGVLYKLKIKIKNFHNQEEILFSDNFVATKFWQQENNILEPKISSWPHGADFSINYNLPHYVEIFYGPDVGKINCLHNKCPVRNFSQVVIKKQSKNNFSRIILPNLEPNKYYKFMAMIKNIKTKNNHIFGGSFRTPAVSGLRFHEILVNPVMKPTEKQYQGEYISLINTQSSKIKINKLGLIISNILGTQKSCLDILPSSIFISSGKKILIVGSDFNRPYDSSNNILVRLKSKNICGGFSNNKSKIIKILVNNNIIDMYSGFFWGAPPGSIIRRRDKMGLDEAKNYWY